MYLDVQASRSLWHNSDTVEVIVNMFTVLNCHCQMFFMQYSIDIHMTSFIYQFDMTGNGRTEMGYELDISKNILTSSVLNDSPAQRLDFISIQYIPTPTTVL